MARTKNDPTDAREAYCDDLRALADFIECFPQLRLPSQHVFVHPRTRDEAKDWIEALTDPEITIAGDVVGRVGGVRVRVWVPKDWTLAPAAAPTYQSWLTEAVAR